jgi:hypothetical protein
MRRLAEQTQILWEQMERLPEQIGRFTGAYRVTYLVRYREGSREWVPYAPPRVGAVRPSTTVYGVRPVQARTKRAARPRVRRWSSRKPTWLRAHGDFGAWFGQCRGHARGATWTKLAWSGGRGSRTGARSTSRAKTEKRASLAHVL